jgi:hypothetical protein
MPRRRQASRWREASSGEIALLAGGRPAACGHLPGPAVEAPGLLHGLPGLRQMGPEGAMQGEQEDHYGRNAVLVSDRRGRS